MGHEGHVEQPIPQARSVRPDSAHPPAGSTERRRSRLAYPALALASLAFALALVGPLGALGMSPDPQIASGPAAAGEPGDESDEASAADTAARVWPLAPGTFWISQPYGCVPQNGYYPTLAGCPPAASGFHNGIDFAADYGTVIYAAASGTVAVVGDDPVGSGNTWIMVQHDGANAGWSTEYYHWQVALVRPGDRVVAGQPIAEVGAAGYATGPHLHFGVVDAAGLRLDPLTWLPAA